MLEKVTQSKTMYIDTKIAKLSLSPPEPARSESGARSETQANESGTTQEAVSFSVNVNLQAVIGIYKHQSVATTNPAATSEAITTQNNDVIDAEYEDVPQKSESTSLSPQTSQAAQAYKSFSDTEENPRGSNVNQYL